MKIAVVTPYFREPPEILQRCMESVRAQTHPCTHYMVADGHRNPVVDGSGSGLRPIALPDAHGDYGGVARTIGSLRAAAETLKEVERLTRLGITINTFMLDDSPGLRAFVERMTRINRGRALYSRPDRLGEYLLVDYLGKKRKKV